MSKVQKTELTDKQAKFFNEITIKKGKLSTKLRMAFQ